MKYSVFLSILGPHTLQLFFLLLLDLEHPSIRDSKVQNQI